MEITKQKEIRLTRRGKSKNNEILAIVDFKLKIGRNGKILENGKIYFIFPKNYKYKLTINGSLEKSITNMLNSDNYIKNVILTFYGDNLEKAKNNFFIDIKTKILEN